MYISTEFDDEHTGKLTYIQKRTRQDITEILNQAIDLYYQQLQSPEKSPLEIFEAVGLVGFIEGSPNLSRDYKSMLSSPPTPLPRWERGVRNSETDLYSA